MPINQQVQRSESKCQSKDTQKRFQSEPATVAETLETAHNVSSLIFLHLQDNKML